MSNYRALRTLTKFGTVIAVATGLMIPVGLVWAMLSTQWSWPLLVLSVVGGVFAGFFVKVIAELTQVIVQMLLPG